MIPRVVVANRKGGVGKTLWASTVAAGYALQGMRVALVDTDPQGHSSLAFGFKKRNGLFEVLANEGEFKDNVVAVPMERFAPPEWTVDPKLYLLPSAKLTAAIPTQVPNNFALHEMLEELTEALRLDMIVLDTGPTASQFDGSVFFAATHFVYVTECSNLSMDGITESLRDLQQLSERDNKYRDWNAQVLAIIPNKARTTNTQRDNLVKIVKHFNEKHVEGNKPGLVFRPIGLADVWQTSQEYGQSIFSFAPESKEAKLAWDFVQFTLKRMGVSDDAGA